MSEKKRNPWQEFGIHHQVWGSEQFRFMADALAESGRKVRLIGVAWGWFGIGIIHYGRRG